MWVEGWGGLGLTGRKGWWHRPLVSHPRLLPSSRDQPLPTPEPQMPTMVPTYDLGMAPDTSMNMQLSPDMV